MTVKTSTIHNTRKMLKHLSGGASMKEKERRGDVKIVPV